MNNKGFLNILLAGIVVIALAGAGYWYWQNQNDGNDSNPTPTAQLTTTPVPTPEINPVDIGILDLPEDIEKWHYAENTDDKPWAFRLPPGWSTHALPDGTLSFTIDDEYDYSVLVTRSIESIHKNPFNESLNSLYNSNKVLRHEKGVIPEIDKEVHFVETERYSMETDEKPSVKSDVGTKVYVLDVPVGTNESCYPNERFGLSTYNSGADATEDLYYDVIKKIVSTLEFTPCMTN